MRINERASALSFILNIKLIEIINIKKNDDKIIPKYRAIFKIGGNDVCFYGNSKVEFKLLDLLMQKSKEK